MLFGFSQAKTYKMRFFGPMNRITKVFGCQKMHPRRKSVGFFQGDEVVFLPKSVKSVLASELHSLNMMEKVHW